MDNSIKYGFHKYGRCNVLITNENGRLHLSISTPTGEKPPTYEEIKQARYVLLPDNVYMAMIFPPKAEFVNLHLNCFHLFEL